MARKSKDEMPNTGFADRLASIRREKGFSQAELAERAGLNKFSIAKIEQGVSEPNWSTVLALASALGVEVGAFVVQDVPPAGEAGQGEAQEAAGEDKGKPAKPKRGQRGGKG